MANIDFKEKDGAVDIQGNVTLNGEVLVTSGTPAVVFAESERQKSKNWCYLTSRYTSGEGVTITVDEETQIITLNGTSTAAFDRGFPKLLLPKIKNCKGKTFTALARSVGEEANVGVYLGTVDDEQSIYDTRFADLYNTPQTFTISDNYTYDYLLIYAPKGVTYNNLQIQIQIEEGTEATDWQYPYGQISHKNDAEVTFAKNEYNKTRNLLSVKNGLNTTNWAGATCTITNDVVTVGGTASANNSINITNFNPKVEKGKTYTLSFYNYSNLSGFNITTATMQNGERVEYNVLNLSSTITTITRTFDADYELHISIYSAPGNSLTGSFQIMLEEATEKSSEYFSYNGEVVHDNDISDVEHVETIYDKDSTDSNINWGYTSGIKPTTRDGITLSEKDFSKYKYLKVYYLRESSHSENYGFTNYVYVDLTTPVDFNSGIYQGTSLESVPYVPLIDTIPEPELSNQIVQINSTKTTIQFISCVYNLDARTTFYYDRFIFTKIEGVY